MTRATVARCAVEGCDKPVGTRLRVCWMHYQRRRRHGTYDVERPTVCTVEGCGRAPRARGLCTVHYQRWWKERRA